MRKVLGNAVLDDAADCSQGMSLEGEEVWPRGGPCGSDPDPDSFPFSDRHTHVG